MLYSLAFKGAWAEEGTSLEGVVEMLDSVNFTCYLAGGDDRLGLVAERLIRLTACFAPLFEFKRWANVYCASRIRAPQLVRLYDANSLAFDEGGLLHTSAASAAEHSV
jgi:hypothetical protein